MWFRPSKSQIDLLLRLSDRQLPAETDLEQLRELTGLPNLSFKDAVALIKAIHISLYEDSAAANDLCYRGGVIADLRGKPDKKNCSSLFAQFAVIASLLTTQATVTRGPWWAMCLLLRSHSQQFRTIAFQRKIAWVVWLMSQPDGFELEDLAPLEELSDIGDINAKTIQHGACKLSVRFNPPYLLRNILLKSSRDRSRSDDNVELHDKELRRKVEVILQGRLPAWRERDAQNRGRTKSQFVEWAMHVGDPMLAELACRHYIAYKRTAPRSASWCAEWQTAIAWGAAGGLHMLSGHPVALAGPSAKFAEACGGVNAQTYYAGLLEDVAKEHARKLSSLSYPPSPEALTHRACECRKICIFLSCGFSLTYVRQGAQHRDVVKRFQAFYFPKTIAAKRIMAKSPAEPEFAAKRRRLAGV